MIRTKNKILKVGSYIIVGFFSILIIASFGLPDYINRINTNSATEAKVNNHSITYFDYVRFVKNSPLANNAEMAEQYKYYIIGQLINQELLAQMAQQMKISINPDIVSMTVKKHFSDENDKFQSDYFAAALRNMVMSSADYFEHTRKDIMRQEIQTMVLSASSLSKSELEFRKRSSLSTFTIKYAVLTNEDLKAQYADRLNVSDGDVDKAYDDYISASEESIPLNGPSILPFGKKENLSDTIKKPDPVEEKKRIRQRLEMQKMTELKNEIANQITELADTGAVFEDASSIIPQESLISKPFHAGEYVYPDAEESQPMYGLESSDDFLEQVVSLDEGKLGHGITTSSGVYMFSVVTRTIPETVEVDPQFANEQAQTKMGVLIKTILGPFTDKSTIIRKDNG